MKICNKCSDNKSLKDFYHQKGKPKSQCKVCEKDYALKYNKTDKRKEVESKYRYKLKGVYGIFSGETCLYVGESKQMTHRWAEHKTNMKKFQQNSHKPLYDNLRRHNNIVFRILEETNNHKEQELTWIQYMTPLYNSSNMY